MKKHHFLHVEFNSTVRLTSTERKILEKYLGFASVALNTAFKKRNIIKNSNKIKSISFSLLLCGDQRIRRLNQQYRSKDYVTDVLSFPSFENLRQTSQHSIINGQVFLGDLAICHPQIKRQAKEFNISYSDEFIHLVIHGILHLLGYDHELSNSEQKIQQKWEDLLVNDISKIKKGLSAL